MPRHLHATLKENFPEWISEAILLGYFVPKLRLPQK